MAPWIVAKAIVNGAATRAWKSVGDRIPAS
jgi:hypothetical protein